MSERRRESISGHQEMQTEEEVTMQTPVQSATQPAISERYTEQETDGEDLKIKKRRKYQRRKLCQ